MMLQDQHYPDWGQTARRFWKKGNNRIVLFWYVVLISDPVLNGYDTGSANRHWECGGFCVGMGDGVVGKLTEA